MVAIFAASRCSAASRDNLTNDCKNFTVNKLDAPKKTAQLALRRLDRKLASVTLTKILEQWHQQ
jgi:hypothetical protein